MSNIKRWVTDKIMKKEYKTYEVHIQHNFKEPYKSYKFFIEEKARNKQEAVENVKRFISKYANPGDNYKVVKAKRVK